MSLSLGHINLYNLILFIPCSKFRIKFDIVIMIIPNNKYHCYIKDCNIGLYLIHLSKHTYLSKIHLILKKLQKIGVLIASSLSEDIILAYCSQNYFYFEKCLTELSLVIKNFLKNRSLNF